LGRLYSWKLGHAICIIAHPDGSVFHATHVIRLSAAELLKQGSDAVARQASTALALISSLNFFEESHKNSLYSPVLSDSLYRFVSKRYNYAIANSSLKVYTIQYEPAARKLYAPK
jgi:hypothetical protein